MRAEVLRIEAARVSDQVRALNGASQAALESVHSRLERIENWQAHHDSRQRLIVEKVEGVEGQLHNLVQLLTQVLNASTPTVQPVVGPPIVAAAATPVQAAATPLAVPPPRPLADTVGGAAPTWVPPVVAGPPAVCAVAQPPTRQTNALTLLRATPRCPPIGNVLPKDFVALLSEWRRQNLGEWALADRRDWDRRLRFSYEKRLYLFQKLALRAGLITAQPSARERENAAALALDADRARAGPTGGALTMSKYLQFCKQNDPAVRRRAPKERRPVPLTNAQVQARRQERDRENERVQEELQEEARERRRALIRDRAAFSMRNSNNTDGGVGPLPAAQVRPPAALLRPGRAPMAPPSPRMPGERELLNHGDMSRHGRQAYNAALTRMTGL